ncbi:MAG TPA: NUDIX domain-containing protein [Candidatus Saccharimonadales bacterium]|nr:NUDIX domain-containing protein [Candidatus Saccharimonadales bacterium]
MAKQSAGIMLYRLSAGEIEVLLVHPGGPFWAKRDDGAWSIPKGEFEPHEEALHAARREFAEEVGRPAPDGALISLGQAKQPGGKVIHAWALQADFDVTGFHSNTFSMEWPPKSGRQQQFPEADKAVWFALPVARQKVVPGQLPFLDRLPV